MNRWQNARIAIESVAPGSHVGPAPVDTRDLADRHRRVLPAWQALYYDEPIELVEGRGCWVYDRAGNPYLDFWGGILTTMVGHAVPEVVQVVASQASRLLHTSTLYLIRSQVELAERIAALSGIPDAKVFFTTSGTEANDAALLLASTYRRSNQVLALRNSYHGGSLTTMAVTGNRGWSPSSLSPLVVHYVQGAYRLRSPWPEADDATYTARCVQDLRDVLTYQTAGDVAALIAEPIQGVGGFTVPPDGCYGALQEVLAETGILYISDEVQTGWGRTGDHFWGYQAHGVAPDLLTFAKGIGNGLALGGVVARAEIMDCLEAAHISTFGGNPLATAGALATLDYLLDHDLQTNARQRGAELRRALEVTVADLDMVAEVRGRGLMVGVELVRADGRTPAPEAAAAVLEATKDRHLLIGRGGIHGNCLRVAPPMSISAAETAEGAGRLSEALREVAAAAAAAGEAR